MAPRLSTPDNGREPEVAEDYLPDKVDGRPGDEQARRRNADIVAKLRAAATMIEIASKVDDNLPEVMSVGVTMEEVTIQPWLPGAPITAIRHFEALMTGPIKREAYPFVLTGAQQVSVLRITGDVNGVQLTVSATTHRDTPVDGFLGVTEQTVAQLAAAETPTSDPGDSLVLEVMPKEAPVPALEQSSDADEGPAEVTTAT